MAAPTFGAAASIASDAADPISFTPGTPTHAADDILVAFALNNSGNPLSTVTSGWNSMGQINGTNNDFHAWWKRATGAGTAGPTITASTGTSIGFCFSVSGCVTSGDPFEDVTTTGDGDTLDDTPDTASVDSTGPDRLALSMFWVLSSGTYTGHPPSGWTSDVNSTLGSTRRTIISKTVASASNVPSVVVGTLASGQRYGAYTLLFYSSQDATVTAVVADAIGDGPLPSPDMAVQPSAAYSVMRFHQAPQLGIAVTVPVADAVGDSPIPTEIGQIYDRPYANVFIGS